MPFALRTVDAVECAVTVLAAVAALVQGTVGVCVPVLYVVVTVGATAPVAPTRTGV